jgi:hypothetical protein
MAKKSNRQPKKVYSGTEPTRSHHITRSGTRGVVRAVPLDDAAPAAQTPIILAEPSALREREALNRLVEAQLEEDFHHEHHHPLNPAESFEPQADNLRAELEVEINDTADVFTNRKASGEVRFNLSHRI